MNTKQLTRLQQAAENEVLSWADVAEIDALAEQAGITNINEMCALDILLELSEGKK
jgi:hypothetical protein